LTRLLSSKSEVVAQLRKRLLTSSQSNPGSGDVERAEVAMYLGDVQGIQASVSDISA